MSNTPGKRWARRYARRMRKIEEARYRKDARRRRVLREDCDATA